MVDVRLLYPSDKVEAATRLAQAIAAEGYAVERAALPASEGFPRLAAEAGKARVLLLIWSRGLVTAAMAAGGIAEARRHANLVEVSADGIEPAFGGEASPVVLLCGWRGQPFHPGWQRILADLKRLCGSRDSSGTREVPSGPSQGLAGAARPAAPGLRPIVGSVAAVGALIAVTLGAASLIDRGTPNAAPAAETRPVAAGLGATPPATPPAPEAMAAAPPPGTEIDRDPPGDTIPATAARSGSASSQKASAGPPRAVAAKSSGARRLAAVSERGVKRYSRKYSKTMRLFCQRSGRSTPQCRTFARSMRALRG